MNKRIEVGCLAIIHGLTVSVELNGVCVEVLKRGEYGEWIKTKDGVEGRYGDPRGGWLVKSDEWQGVEPVAEKNLLRIDDYAEETETQEEEMAV